MIIEKAKVLGLIKGVTIGVLPNVTHLQFADDTILFLEDDWKSIRGIKIVLSIFESLSGLKFNYHKSFLYAPNSPSNIPQSWATWLQCKEGQIPFTHLGATIGASCEKKSFWKPLTKRISTRLGKWRCNTLSKQGRVTLINTVLDSLPVYWLALYRLPRSIVEEIEKLKRRFYWKEIGETQKVARKLHSIKWDIICKGRREGGLGIKKLDKKNLSMLAKWWWKAKTNRGKLWYNVMSAKYGGLMA